MTTFRQTVLFGILCLELSFGALFAQSNLPSSPAAPVKNSSSIDHRRTGSFQMPRRASLYYQSLWGIDSFVVKTAESGELIRFSYRVVNPGKSKAIFDKKEDPFLYDERAHVRLVVPSLEKVGALRQTSSNPVEGQSYWMAFSNTGRPVKKGDQVSVVIGRFRVDGLTVQ